MAVGSFDVVVNVELCHEPEALPVSAGGRIYGPHNVRPGCKVLDDDSGEEIELVSVVDTDRGEIEQHARPLRLNAAQTGVETVRTRFRKIVTIFHEGGLPELFICYGRIRDEADPAATVAPAPHRGESIVPAAARRHVARPFRFYGPFEISSALASCAGDEPRRDVVCPDCAMPSDGITPEDVTRSAVRKLAAAAAPHLVGHFAAAAVQHVVGHFAVSVGGRATAKPALPALTVTAGERYRTLIG